ncbi:MAG: phytoene desaturase family protein [Candidatus Cyclobacteriaceae bacterium M3_2C_046]
MPQLDAVVVGSGPNGLSAAIYLQYQGLNTAVYEQADQPGGATRTSELTLPGFKHDMGSAIHPLTVDSPFLSTLPLPDFGLEWVYPDIPFAHPMAADSGLAAFKDVMQTAGQLGPDQENYLKIMTPLVKQWDQLANDMLGPLKWPQNLPAFISFGARALLPAQAFTKHYFKKESTRLLFYGAAAHSTLPLSALASSSFGLVLLILAHKNGWPFPRGGAAAIHQSMIKFYQFLGGKVFLSSPVSNLKDLPSASAYLLDLTPRQVLELNGTRFSRLYRKRLSWYRYGAGIFKIDWALSEPIPWKSQLCRKAGTIHIGFSTAEIEHSEKIIHHGKNTDRPYVLLAQHTLFDPTRAPEGKHTAWAYCHVPHGNLEDQTAAIENQLEKAAPGFREIIVARSTKNTLQMEAFDPNLVGGDVNGGKQHIGQLFTRPVARLSPYTTPDPGVYICSSSTPPGGGVHGMCGYHAARKVWQDHFQ